MVPSAHMVLVNSRKGVSFHLPRHCMQTLQGSASVCYGRTQVSTQPAELEDRFLIALASVTKSWKFGLISMNSKLLIFILTNGTASLSSFV